MKRYSIRKSDKMCDIALHSVTMINDCAFYEFTTRAGFVTLTIPSYTKVE